MHNYGYVYLAGKCSFYVNLGILTSKMPSSKPGGRKILSSFTLPQKLVPPMKLWMLRTTIPWSDGNGIASPSHSRITRFSRFLYVLFFQKKKKLLTWRTWTGLLCTVTFARAPCSRACRTTCSSWPWTAAWRTPLSYCENPGWSWRRCRYRNNCSWRWSRPCGHWQWCQRCTCAYVLAKWSLTEVESSPWSASLARRGRLPTPTPPWRSGHGWTFSPNLAGSRCWQEVPNFFSFFPDLTWPVWILDERIDDGNRLVRQPGTALGPQGGQAHHGPHRQAATPCNVRREEVVGEVAGAGSR